MAANNSFSPVTLFECTVSNACMLVDSMEERDLVIALRVTNQLQSKIVEVLDPKLGNLIDRVNAKSPVNTSNCATAIQIQNSSNQSVDPNEPLYKRMKLHDTIASEEFMKQESKSFCSDINSPVKVKDEDFGDSDDDVILLEPDELFNHSTLSALICNHSRGPTNVSTFDNMSLNVGANSSILEMSIGNVKNLSRNNSHALGDPSGDVRSYMRQAYKNLKGTGPHLFDFSQPFSSTSNQNVANRVVEEAQSMVGGNPWGNDIWRKVASSIFRKAQCNRGSAMKKYNRRLSKLSRRQRSFETIFPTLEPDMADRYRIVLSRDFTSSDEEIEDEGDGNGSPDGTLRVRVLPWESATVREMKARLDDVYLTQFASEKQRNQIRGTIRNSLVQSTRSCPDNAPPWAVENFSPLNN